MASRYGQCTNTTGDCFTAESGRILSVQADAPFVCPDCGEPLLRVINPVPARPLWVAPAVLGLTLLAGVAMHYWPDARTETFKSAVKPHKAVKAEVVPSKPVTPPGRKPGNAQVYSPLNTRVPNSGFCLDCESYYLVYNGKGGKIRRSEGYTTRCCRCGTTVAFSDGYYYDIICEGKKITAKMGRRVSDGPSSNP